MLFQTIFFLTTVCLRLLELKSLQTGQVIKPSFVSMSWHLSGSLDFRRHSSHMETKYPDTKKACFFFVMLNCPCTLALKTWLTWLRCYRRGYEWHFQDMQYKEDPNELPYPVFYFLKDSDLLCGSVKWFTRVLVTVIVQSVDTPLGWMKIGTISRRQVRVGAEIIAMGGIKASQAIFLQSITVMVLQQLSWVNGVMCHELTKNIWPMLMFVVVIKQNLL